MDENERAAAAAGEILANRLLEFLLLIGGDGGRREIFGGSRGPRFQRSSAPTLWTAGTLTSILTRFSAGERPPLNTSAWFAAAARVVAMKMSCVPAMADAETGSTLSDRSSCTFWPPPQAESIAATNSTDSQE